MPQPQTNQLDPRDHLLARKALTEVVAERARQGVEGEALRRVALDTAEALRDGLFVLSAVAEFGSSRRSPDAQQ